MLEQDTAESSVYRAEHRMQVQVKECSSRAAVESPVRVSFSCERADVPYPKRDRVIL